MQEKSSRYARPTVASRKAECTGGVVWVLDKPGEREVLEAVNKLVRSA